MTLPRTSRFYETRKGHVGKERTNDEPEHSTNETAFSWAKTRQKNDVSKMAATGAKKKKKVCTSCPVIATNEQQNVARLFFLAKEFRTLLIHGLNNSQQHAKLKGNKRSAKEGRQRWKTTSRRCKREEKNNKKKTTASCCWGIENNGQPHNAYVPGSSWALIYDGRKITREWRQRARRLTG